MGRWSATPSGAPRQQPQVWIPDRALLGSDDLAFQFDGSLLGSIESEFVLNVAEWLERHLRLRRASFASRGHRQPRLSGLDTVTASSARSTIPTGCTLFWNPSNPTPCIARGPLPMVFRSDPIVGPVAPVASQENPAGDATFLGDARRLLASYRPRSLVVSIDMRPW